MNTGTKLRTILAVASSINTALMATDLTGFHNPTVDMIYKIASIILNFVIVAIATYYNNDFTEVACRYTGAMRLEKEQAKGIITGENFFDEAENIGFDLSGRSVKPVHALPDGLPLGTGFLENLPQRFSCTVECHRRAVK